MGAHFGKQIANNPASPGGADCHSRRKAQARGALPVGPPPRGQQQSNPQRRLSDGRADTVPWGGHRTVAKNTRSPPPHNPMSPPRIIPSLPRTHGPWPLLFGVGRLAPARPGRWLNADDARCQAPLEWWVSDRSSRVAGRSRRLLVRSGRLTGCIVPQAQTEPAHMRKLTSCSQRSSSTTEKSQGSGSASPLSSSALGALGDGHGPFQQP